MNALSDKRFLFVVGKGGVGKTTVAAALGLAAARKGKKVLIAMVNTKERLSGLLGVPPIDHNIREVAPGLDAVNMTPQASLEEYGMMILKVRALYSAIFENKLVRAFLRGTPGIEAWTMLGKAYFHASGHGPGAAGEYDLVLLDAPATGHGLDMLRVPQAIVDVAPPGLLRREAERALELFRDEKRAGALLVTLAEDMPTNETIELEAAIRKLGMSSAGLVINQVLPKLFDAQTSAQILKLASEVPHDDAIATLVDAGRIRAHREAVQTTSLQRLDGLNLPKVRLPHLFAPEFARDQIDSLSRAFD